MVATSPAPDRRERGSPAAGAAASHSARKSSVGYPSMLNSRSGQSAQQGLEFKHVGPADMALVRPRMNGDAPRRPPRGRCRAIPVTLGHGRSRRLRSWATALRLTERSVMPRAPAEHAMKRMAAIWPVNVTAKLASCADRHVHVSANSTRGASSLAPLHSGSTTSRLRRSQRPMQRTIAMPHSASVLGNVPKTKSPEITAHTENR